MQLEDQGFTVREIEEKVDAYRKQLLNKEVGTTIHISHCNISQMQSSKD